MGGPARIEVMSPLDEGDGNLRPPLYQGDSSKAMKGCGGGGS